MMKIVLQRVSEAQVVVDNEIVGSIDKGLMVLVGIGPEDTEDQARILAEKCAVLRIFDDDEGKMNRSLVDVGGEILAVSQFTLYGDASKGRRPSFVHAASPEEAELLYRRFVDACRRGSVPVAEGRFGAMMDVELVNDGPVTLVIDR